MVSSGYAAVAVAVPAVASADCQLSGHPRTRPNTAYPPAAAGHLVHVWLRAQSQDGGNDDEDDDAAELEHAFQHLLQHGHAGLESDGPGLMQLLLPRHPDHKSVLSSLGCVRFEVRWPVAPVAVCCTSSLHCVHVCVCAMGCAAQRHRSNAARAACRVCVLEVSVCPSIRGPIIKRFTTQRGPSKLGCVKGIHEQATACESPARPWRRSQGCKVPSLGAACTVGAALRAHCPGLRRLEWDGFGVWDPLIEGLLSQVARFPPLPLEELELAGIDRLGEAHLAMLLELRGGWVWSGGVAAGEQASTAPSRAIHGRAAAPAPRPTYADVLVQLAHGCCK